MLRILLILRTSLILASLISLLLISGQNSEARPIISGISANEINIDSNFAGQKILLFGAKGDVGDIVIVVRGPKKSYIVNKKAQIFGVWHNRKRMKFDEVYSYYSLFSTNPELSDQELFKRLEIGKENIVVKSPNSKNKGDEINFKLHLINKLSDKNLYLTNSDKINFLDETLFKVMIDFPKNISQGEYLVEIYLIDESSLIAYQSIPIYVNQTGFSAEVNKMAHDHALVYALMAILLAVLAGYIANFIFAKLFK